MFYAAKSELAVIIQYHKYHQTLGGDEVDIHDWQSFPPAWHRSMAQWIRERKGDDPRDEWDILEELVPGATEAACLRVLEGK